MVTIIQSTLTSIERLHFFKRPYIYFSSIRGKSSGLSVPPLILFGAHRPACKRISTQTRAYLVPDTSVSRPRYDRISTLVRMRLNPRALTSIGIKQHNLLGTKRTEENPLTYSLFPFHQRYIEKIRHSEQRTKQMGANTCQMQT